MSSIRPLTLCNEEAVCRSLRPAHEKPVSSHHLPLDWFHSPRSALTPASGRPDDLRQGPRSAAVVPAQTGRLQHPVAGSPTPPPGGSPAPVSSWSRPTTSPPAAASAHTPAPPLPSISSCSCDLLWGTATGLRAHQRVSVQGEAGRLEEIEVIPTPKPLQAKGSISRISTKFTHVSREPVLGPSDWWLMTSPSGNKRLT